MEHSPLDIEVMMYCYARGDQHPRYGNESVDDSHNRLLCYHLIEMDKSKGENGYKATDKGLAWVGFLCNTPFPVKAYIDPRSTDGE